jgi:hypothetical protein
MHGAINAGRPDGHLKNHCVWTNIQRLDCDIDVMLCHMRKVDSINEPLGVRGIQAKIAKAQVYRACQDKCPGKRLTYVSHAKNEEIDSIGALRLPFFLILWSKPVPSLGRVGMSNYPWKSSSHSDKLRTDSLLFRASAESQFFQLIIDPQFLFESQPQAEAHRDRPVSR